MNKHQVDERACKVTVAIFGKETKGCGLESTLLRQPWKADPEVNERKIVRVKVMLLFGGLFCIGNGEEVVSQHLSYVKARTRLDSIAIVEWYSKNESNPGLLKEAYEAHKANVWLRKYGLLSGLGAAMLSVAAANQVQDCKSDPDEKDCDRHSGASIIGAGVGSVLIILGVGSYFYTPKAERNFMASILDSASTLKNQSGGSHKEELDKP